MNFVLVTKTDHACKGAKADSRKAVRWEQNKTDVDLRWW